MDRVQNYLENTPKAEQKASAIAFFASLDTVSERSPDVALHIEKELADQRRYLKLIASENYSSSATQLAMGNLLTDKYSEGYAFHRFYAGCQNVDAIEAMANEELKSLFGAEHAYVQPHSGADANLVAFWAVILTRVQNQVVERLGKKNLDALSDSEYESLRQLLVNQKVMGMSLNAGGHLTHGYRHNCSSKFMRSVTYDVDPKTERLDYDQLEKQAIEEKPLILLAGYSAYPRRLDFARMREIADKAGAVLMVDMAHFSGLVAGKVLKNEYNPIPYADIVTTTTHKTLRGPRGGAVLCKEEFREFVDKGCPLVLGGPLPHVMAAKAVAFKEANTPEFQAYAQKVCDNAQALAEALQHEGIRVISGGTENHLVILDTGPFNITGRQAEMAFRDAHLTVNRNAIPNDPNGPWYTSGVRVGTPAITTLGMGKSEMQEIASIMKNVLTATRALPVPGKDTMSKAKYEMDEGVKESLQGRTRELLSQFPLYPEIPLLDANLAKTF